MKPTLLALASVSLTSAFAVVLSSPANAQGGIRSWGAYRCDTAFEHQPLIMLTGCGSLVGLKPDGSLWFSGPAPDFLLHPPTPPAGATFRKLVAGTHHLVGLCTDGSAIAWGTNIFGESDWMTSGNPSVDDVATGDFFSYVLRGGQIVKHGYWTPPVPVAPLGHHFVAVTNSEFPAGRLETGEWIQGCLTPDCSDSHVPVGVSYEKLWLGSTSMGIRSDGGIEVWGVNAPQLQVLIDQIPPLPAGLRYVDVALLGSHYVVRRDDGQVFAGGANTNGQCDIPALPPGLKYFDFVATQDSTVLRRSDGTNFERGARWNPVPCEPGVHYVQQLPIAEGLWMLRSDGRVAGAGHWSANSVFNSVPVLPSGVRYTKLTYGPVALRSDGQVASWWGSYPNPTTTSWLMPPALPVGMSYEDVQFRGGAIVAVRSDDALVTWGWNNFGQCNVPALPPGVRFQQVDACAAHCIALLSDHTIVTWGLGTQGQCAPAPVLAPGLEYVEVAAGSGSGYSHSLARVSDGSVVAWGANYDGQCNVPPPPAGLRYTQITAGADFSAAILSNGTIVTWGSNRQGQCDVPALPPGMRYVEITANINTLVARYDEDPSYSAGEVYCVVGGSNTSCPCDVGLPAQGLAGCTNSTGVGASLTTNGVASVQYDTLRLRAMGLPSTAPAILVQGSARLDVTFGDGLRCVGGNVVRIGMRAAQAGLVDFGSRSTPVERLSTRGGVPAVGGTRHYQVCYRDAANFCTPSTRNSSNGVSVAWTP